jgi:hypothetical protein
MAKRTAKKITSAHIKVASPEISLPSLPLGFV